MSDEQSPTTPAPPPAQPPSGRQWFLATIRYGKMSFSAKFRTDRQDLVKQRDKCVVRSDRGKEIGYVLTHPEPVPPNQSAEGYGEILRKATVDDVRNAERIDKESRTKAIAFCKEQAKKLNLQMKVVECDYVLGGERTIFYFTSQIRVDFRDLVRHLAREMRSRIELKQVGARDEARLVGDCGHCGLTLC